MSHALELVPILLASAVLVVVYFPHPASSAADVQVLSGPGIQLEAAGGLVLNG
jgi:hypothetical protein